MQIQQNRNSSGQACVPFVVGGLLLLTGTVTAALPAAAQNVPATPAQPPNPTDEPQPPSPENPPEEPGSNRRRFQIGPEAGFYLPSSDKASDAFGRVFTNIGIGFGGVQQALAKGRAYFDLNVITNRRRGSDVALIPVGIAYRRSLARREASYFNPYYGFAADIVGVHTQSERYQLPSRFRFAVSGSAFGGFTLGDSGYIQARYYAMNAVRGINLSGTSIAIGYRF